MSRQKPSCQLTAARSCRFEPIPDIAPDLITTGADGRTDRRDEAGGTASEFPDERRNRRGRYAGGKTTPPGMRASHGASTGIGEEERNAVGRLDGQGDRVIAGQDDISLRKAARDVLRDHNVSAMNLTHANEARRVHVHRTRDIVPERRIIATSSRVAKRPAPRGKDVRGQRRERTADERRSGRGLHPIECLARLRKI